MRTRTGLSSAIVCGSGDRAPNRGEAGQARDREQVALVVAVLKTRASQIRRLAAGGAGVRVADADALRSAEDAQVDTVRGDARARQGHDRTPEIDERHAAARGQADQPFVQSLYQRLD